MRDETTTNGHGADAWRAITGTRVSRRRFLRTVGLGAVASQFPWLKAGAQNTTNFKNLIAPDKKLRIACIGVGGKGYSDMQGCAGEEFAAFCDVDFVTAARGFHEHPSVPRFRDFRQMLHEMGDKIDAVTVTTPDHTHYPAALMAIEMGKHVYVQKPLTHTIGEARALKTAVRKAGIVSNMGNQGHANEGTRLVKEWIDAGAIGKVREVLCWTNRPIWAQGIDLPESEPLRDTIDWNLWLGVAPERFYSKALAPFAWRGWWDYGCGALGDMGCHLLDAPFWALDLRGDVKVTAESPDTNAVCAPSKSKVVFEFPARGNRGPIKLSWYDGGLLPPVPAELGPNAKLPRGGMIILGEKGGIMNEGDYCESPHLIPDQLMKDFKRPEKTIPRVPKSNPHLEWITACKGGPTPGSNIVDHSADLTEMVLLGNLALRLGKPLEWDAEKGVCVNCPEADILINKQYRVF